MREAALDRPSRVAPSGAIIGALSLMIIKREPLIIDSSLYADDFGVPRAAGCHLMAVVDYMEEQLQIADHQRNALPPEALEWYRFGGFMTEHMFARHAIEMECLRDPAGLVRPDPVMWCEQCDAVIYGGAVLTLDHCRTYNHKGIHASPDAMMMKRALTDEDEVAEAVRHKMAHTVECWRLKEWKCTWKTQKRAGGDQDGDKDREHLTTGIWRWPKQTKGYAYLMETLEAELWALFVNGKYAPPVPSGDKFLMTFTQRELESDWSGIVSFARKGGLL
jgi:hypothetical protein